MNASFGKIDESPPSTLVSDTPLLRPFSIWGLVLGIAAIGLSGDPLTGFIVVVLFLSAGLLWFRTGVPIFAFCILYQSVFVVTGYFYWRWFGSYPGMRYLGDLELATWYSMLGFLALSLGIWAAAHGCVSKKNYGNNDYDIMRLFWIVLALFSVNWGIEITGVGLRLVAFNVAQILHHTLMIRYMVLYLLLLTVIRQREHFGLGLIAFGYVLLPELISSMTKFKDLFFLFVIVLLSQWRPGARKQSERKRNRWILTIAFSLSIFLVIVGVIWSGAMKHSWRTALTSGAVSGSPMQKIGAYGEHAARSIENFEFNQGFTELASRLSSGLAYFSHVLRVVPDYIDHEGGALSGNAVNHILMPRFLFPEKPDLGGDSWLVRKYARLNVSGDESGTSVGMGYMAEFYIDFGFPGMLVPLVIYGLILGGMYRALNSLSPSTSLFSALVSGLFLLHFLSYEGNFAKLLGGVVQNFVILSVLLIFFGQKVHVFLLGHGSSSSRSAGTSDKSAMAWPNHPPTR